MTTEIDNEVYIMNFHVYINLTQKLYFLGPEVKIYENKMLYEWN